MFAKYLKRLLTYFSGTLVFLASGFLIGWALGLIIGVFGSLMFAPHTGIETRESLKERAMEIKDKAIKAGKDTLQRTKDIAQEARQAAQEKTDELSKKYNLPID